MRQKSMCYDAKNVHNHQLRSRTKLPKDISRQESAHMLQKKNIHHTTPRLKSTCSLHKTFTTSKYVHNTHPKTFQDRKMHDCVMYMSAAADNFQSCLQCTVGHYRYSLKFLMLKFTRRIAFFPIAIFLILFGSIMLNQHKETLTLFLIEKQLKKWLNVNVFSVTHRQSIFFLDHAQHTLLKGLSTQRVWHSKSTDTLPSRD